MKKGYFAIVSSGHYWLTTAMSRINSRSCKPSQRRHHLNQRILLLALALMTTVAALVVVTCPDAGVYFPHPSWRNVSLLQLIKMHLAPRPTSLYMVRPCRNWSRPGIQRTDIEQDSRVQYYESAREKFNHTNHDELWKEAFLPALNKDEKVSLLHIYGVFKHALDSAGVDHVLLHGSAVGAWRHRGVIPWDDDIDVGVSIRHWTEVSEALSCIPGFLLDSSTNSKWSFYSSNGASIPTTNDKLWPFLDIYFYTEDDHYVWAINYVHLQKFVFRKGDMFPTTLVPFESFMAPVPGRLLEVLQHEYVTPDLCVSHYMNHKEGGFKSVVSVSCADLKSMYTIYQ